MNAHANELAARQARPMSRDPRRIEGEQLLRFLDAEIAGFEDLVRGLRDKREKLVADLDALDVPSGPSTCRKAPHGAVRSIILKELGAAQAGLDVQTLSRRVSRALPSVHPRSIRQALTRLLEHDAVTTDGTIWRTHASSDQQR